MKRENGCDEDIVESDLGLCDIAKCKGHWQGMKYLRQVFYEDLNEEVGQAGLDVFEIFLGDLHGHIGADANGCKGFYGGFWYGVEKWERSKGWQMFELSEDLELLVRNTCQKIGWLSIGQVNISLWLIICCWRRRKGTCTSKECGGDTMHATTCMWCLRKWKRRIKFGRGEVAERCWDDDWKLECCCKNGKVSRLFVAGIGWSGWLDEGTITGKVRYCVKCKSEDRQGNRRQGWWVL